MLLVLLVVVVVLLLLLMVLLMVVVVLLLLGLMAIIGANLRYLTWLSFNLYKGVRRGGVGLLMVQGQRKG